MYSINESFFFEIDEEDIELTVIGDIFLDKKEYIITEDLFSKKYVFLFDEEDEEIYLIEDSSEDIILQWEDEYYGTSDSGSWNSDIKDFDESIKEYAYNECDSYEEIDEDFNSYIDHLNNE